jgi:hypothetical protein
MVEHNASLPKHHRIEYRIGVNLGDVATEANDVMARASILPHALRLLPSLATFTSQAASTSR